MAQNRNEQAISLTVAPTDIEKRLQIECDHHPIPPTLLDCVSLIMMILYMCQQPENSTTSYEQALSSCRFPLPFAPQSIDGLPK